MGIVSSCEKCPSAVTGSVINFSDALMLRISEGIEIPTSTSDSCEDNSWFAKIKCIDDSHSMAYGLESKAFERLVDKVDKRIKEFDIDKYKSPCPSNNVIACYKTNTECTLQCTKEVEDFIDCIDTKRLQTLKKRVEEDKKKTKINSKQIVGS